MESVIEFVRKVESEEARVLDQREIERGEGELRIKKMIRPKTVATPGP